MRCRYRRTSFVYLTYKDIRKKCKFVLLATFIIIISCKVIFFNFPPPCDSYRTQDRYNCSVKWGDNEWSSSRRPTNSTDPSQIRKDIRRMVKDLNYKFTLKTRERVVDDVNCRLISKGDKVEIRRAQKFQNTYPKTRITAEDYIYYTQDCKRFIERRGYIMRPSSQEAEDFPLAFSVMTYRDVEQVERLLRAIYRPHNYYCVHVDAKASAVIYTAIESITSCFPNIIMLHPRLTVTWGTYSVLEQDVKCMHELLLNFKKWKYFINLSGQEFPLKTNWEIVKILKTYNGANDSPSKKSSRRKENLRSFREYKGFVSVGGKILDPPPHGITAYSGYLHVLASRGFANFSYHSQVARDFRTWSKVTEVPDETYFSTLNRSPFLHVPGAYSGQDETLDTATRFKIFYHTMTWDIDVEGSCSGRYVHEICIFGLGDLKSLVSKDQHYLIANKLYSGYQPLTLDCLESILHNRTLNNLNGVFNIDIKYYRQFNFVRDHLPSE